MSPDKKRGSLDDVNKGLPKEGMPRRFSDDYVRAVLKELHIQELNFDRELPPVDVEELKKIYESLGILTSIEVSSRKSRTFNGQSHPQVEGYLWQRGTAVEVHGIIPTLVGKNQVFLFTPERLDYQDGIIYIDGNIGSSDVLTVVRGYMMERQVAMKKAGMSPDVRRRVGVKSF